MRKVKRYNTDGTVIQSTQNRKTKGHTKCFCDGCKGTRGHRRPHWYLAATV